MRRLSVALILCAALALPGCLRPAEKGAPLDSRIRVVLREILSPAGRTLELSGATERIYPCCNYSLMYGITRWDGRIDVRFTGVHVPDICLTALGPARCTIPLGPTREGTQVLTLGANGHTGAGSLVVTSDAIEIRGATSPRIEVERPLLRRVPPSTIWGLVGWGPGDQSARAKAFLDSLVSVGARPVHLSPGDYDYFRIGPTGEIETPPSHGYWFARAYLLHYEGDREALAGVVRAFGDSLSISMNDDLGAHWYSWALRGGAVVAALARR